MLGYGRPGERPTRRLLAVTTQCARAYLGRPGGFAAGRRGTRAPAARRILYAVRKDFFVRDPSGRPSFDRGTGPGRRGRSGRSGGSPLAERELAWGSGGAAGGAHERVSHSPTENWVGFLSISLIIIAVTSSLYYKSKRSEILIFAFIIIILWVFHSSSFLSYGTYEESSSWLSTRDRYMIPVMPLSYFLIGFIVLQLWLHIKKFFKNRPKKSFH